MDGDKSLTATYSLNTYTLTVNATNGTVTKLPDQTAYDHGTVVQLTASPATGYHFVNWTGDASGTDPTTTVTMDGAKSVTANFAIDTLHADLHGRHGRYDHRHIAPDGRLRRLGHARDSRALLGYHFVDWSDGVLPRPAPTRTSPRTSPSRPTSLINTYTLSVTSDHGTIVKAPDLPAYDHGDLGHDHGHAGRRVHLHRLDGIRHERR